MEITLELLNPHPAMVRLNGIAHRILFLEPAFDEVMQVLEEGEQRLFDSYYGRYVDTGALMDPLTLPDADGAIREAHPEHAEFGTAIPYAVYQREGGRSAILRLDETEEQAIAHIVLKYIADGPEP